MFLFYSISAIVCFAAFCAAHYKDVNDGIDLEISDIVFTIILTLIPFFNTLGAFYALSHIGFFKWSTRWMKLTVIKGKQ